MQENLQKISPAKQRLLQFIDSLSISKREFYHITGVSRGTLESKTGLTEPILAKILAKYPDLDPVWVLTGEKSRHPPNPPVNREQVREPESPYAISPACHNCALYRQIIDAQRITIKTLEDRVADLEGQKRKAC